MTQRKLYIGSVGPFLYDDEDPINDEDGDFAGEGFTGVRTSGSVRASLVDEHPDALTKKGDFNTHGSRHAPGGSDPIPTKVVTVVTAVDFVNETVTTEDVTVFDV